jgi:iron complex transport system substrate-binding protein
MYTNSKNIITKTMLSNATVGQISVEVIFEANPDVIFIDWGGYSLCRDDYARLKSSFDSLNAFQNGSLYGVIDYNWYAANYDTLLANCYWVGKVLYPEAFEDIDPVEKANEIYQLWVGQPIYDQVVANCGGGYERVSLG